MNIVEKANKGTKNMKAYSASDVIALAKEQKIEAKLLKRFSNGQELREYVVKADGMVITRKIGAFPHEHA